MTPEVSHYLENIKYNSRLSLSDEEEVITEIETHIEDRLQELTRNNGLNIYVIAIGTEADIIKQGPLGEIATKLATITKTSLLGDDPVVCESINL